MTFEESLEIVKKSAIEFADKVTKNFSEKIAEFSVALVTVALSENELDIKGGIANITQTDIRALNLATASNMAKKLAEQMQEKVKLLEVSNPLQSKIYSLIGETLHVEADAYNNRLNEYAQLNKATVGSTPFETVENISHKFNTNLFSKLDRAIIFTNIGEMIVDFVENYKISDSINSETLLDFTGSALEVIRDYATTLEKFKAPSIDNLVSKLGLNPKTLLGVAAKGFAINAVLTLDYVIVKAVAEAIFDSEYVHLYDREWFVSASDKIFGSLDNIAIGSAEFDAVSSVYALLQANADKNYQLSIEEWNILFGSDEVRNMDIAKVKDVLASAVKIVTGKEITVNTTEDMVNAVKEYYDEFQAVRGFGFMVPLSENFWQDHIHEDNDFGLAMRYALKNLNSFIISSNKAENIVIDYAPLNQHGELNLYSADNPNGMTEKYIQDRLNMLKSLIFNQSHDDEYHDLSFGIILGNSLDSAYGDDADYSSIADKPHKKIVFGTDDNDSNIQGGVMGDNLYGGAGNDTLKGGTQTITENIDGANIVTGEEDDNARDYLEGGTGFDTYYAGNRDVIFDADGEGKIYFNNRELNQNFVSSTKYQEGNQNGVWYELDENGHKTGVTAIQQDQNLLIKENGNTLTIQNFFQVASLEDGKWAGLDLVLSYQEEETTPPEIIGTPIDGVGKYNQINVYNNKISIQYYGRQTEWDGIGIDLGGDVLMGTGAKQVYAQMSKYDDKVFGSLNADVIYGNDGNDHIYGSQYLSPEKDTRTQEQKDADADYIVGGNGVDLIYGLAGNDIIYAGNVDEHLMTSDDVHLNNTHMTDESRGDWVIGGEGDDQIFGSQKSDLLLGDSGSDTIYGGASDDVILGDAFIRPNLKGKYITITDGQLTKEYLWDQKGYYEKDVDNISLLHPAMANGN